MGDVLGGTPGRTLHGSLGRISLLSQHPPGSFLFLLGAARASIQKRRYLPNTQRFSIQKTHFSGTGVCEINDAGHMSWQTAFWASRALDFNVERARAQEVYITRHFFRRRDHPPNLHETSFSWRDGRLTFSFKKLNIDIGGKGDASDPFSLRRHFFRKHRYRKKVSFVC